MAINLFRQLGGTDPTEAGRMGPGGAVRLPLLRPPSTSFIPDDVGRAVFLIGNTIANMAAEMKQRQDSIKATELMSESRERIADYRNSLNPKDYAENPEKVKTFTEGLMKEYMKRAGKFGNRTRAEFQKTFRSYNATEYISALKEAKGNEVVAIKAQLGVLKDRLMGAIADHGAGSLYVRGAAESLFAALDNAAPVLGEDFVEGVKYTTRVDMEDQTYSQRIYKNPQSVLDGGLEQFQYTNKGRQILVQARAELDRQDNIIDAKRKADMAGLKNEVGELATQLNLVDPSSWSIDIIKLTVNALKAEQGLANLEKKYAGTKHSDKVTDFVDEQRARLEASKMVLQFKRAIVTAPLDKLSSMMNDFEEASKELALSEDPDAGLEMQNHMLGARKFVEDRIQEITDTKTLEAVFRGEEYGEDAQRVFEKALDGPAPEVLGKITGTDTRDLSLRNWILANRHKKPGTDNRDYMGPGTQYAHLAYTKSGFVPKFLWEAFNSDLVTRDDGPRDHIRRTAAVEAAAAFTRHDPALRQQLSDEMRAAVIEFEIQQPTDPETFGAALWMRSDPNRKIRADRDRPDPQRIKQLFIAEVSGSFSRGFGMGSQILNSILAIDAVDAMNPTEEEMKAAKHKSGVLIGQMIGTFFDKVTEGPKPDKGDLRDLRRHGGPQYIYRKFEHTFNFYRDTLYYDNDELAAKAAAKAILGDVHPSSMGRYAEGSTRKAGLIERATDWMVRNSQVPGGKIALDIFRGIKQRNLVLQDRPIDHPAYGFGSAEVIALRAAPVITAIRGTFFLPGEDKDPFVVSASDILEGVIMFQVDDTVIGENGLPVWRIIDADGRPLFNEDGEIYLYQPEPDRTAQAAKLRLARTVSPLFHARNKVYGAIENAWQRILPGIPSSDLEAEQISPMPEMKVKPFGEGPGRTGHRAPWQDPATNRQLRSAQDLLGSIPAPE